MAGPRIPTDGDRPNAKPSMKRALALSAVAIAAAAALWLTGLLSGADRSLQTAFFAVQGRDASGQLVVVEMDAASLAAIRRWPWDREHYAELVDKLDAAGARSIAFDVDFSAASAPDSDERLRRSLASARSLIILPTFSQAAAHGSGRVLDSLPIESLRQTGSLASVSVLPDSDGQVRRMPLGTITATMPRPSLSAQIAQRAGSADRSFPLDRSIEAATIPRLSFIAVEWGEFDPALVKGKDILIGATAVEMGDRYAVPGYGVLPGVIIQAMAAETLFRGIPVEADGTLSLVLALIFGPWVVRSKSRAEIAARTLLAGISLAVTLQVGWSAFLVLFEIAPGLVALVIMAALRLMLLLRAEQVHRSTHDQATGLANRRAMKQAAAGTFVIAASIVNFERLQSVLGDEGLAELVGKLAARIAAWTGGVTVYRIDDRVLAWFPPDVAVTPEQTLPELGGVLRQAVEVESRHVDAQIAFGIAADGAIVEAALAASEAARAGEQSRYHAAAERAVVEQQVSLMGELEAAIALGQLEVAYQPKLHLASDRINAVEALVRWNHPQRGYLRPDLFIPLAEEVDRIDDLTLFVLRQTIADLGEWCSQGLVLHAAVNISARLLSSAHFIAAAEELLRGTGVPRNRLIFEVTESATFRDADVATEALEAFDALGVAISMDDYGTGQSTLSYLKRLPLSELKIDRSFVQFAHRDRSDALLVRSTLNLAHELGLQVVAEGVEEPECLQFLRDIGCDYAQGYLIGKPMSSTALRELLQQEVALAAQEWTLRPSPAAQGSSTAVSRSGARSLSASIAWRASGEWLPARANASRKR